MSTIEERTMEAEQYFAELKACREDTLHAYDHIVKIIDTALSTQDIELLLSLTPYIETGDGHLAFQHIGKVHRILRMLYIIHLEHKYQKTIFCTNCPNTDALLAKYMQTLLALRRISFQLSDSSIAEAIEYLKEYPISHFAAYFISKEELLCQSPAYYESLTDIFSDNWKTEDIHQFFALLRA